MRTLTLTRPWLGLSLLLVLFTGMLLLATGCVRGAVCRKDSGCPQEHVCRVGECFLASSLGQVGETCKGDFACLSQRCKQGQCVSISQPSEAKDEAPTETNPSDAGQEGEAQPPNPCDQGFCASTLEVWGGPSDDNITSFHRSAQNDLIVTGYVTGAGRIGGRSIVAIGKRDGFVGKCKISGKCDWVKPVGGNGIDSVHEAATDSEGDVIIVGSFTGSIHIPPSPIQNSPSAEDYNAFVGKFSKKDGMPKWFFGAGGFQQDTAQSIAVDSEDNIYVLGSFERSIRFGSHSLQVTGPGALDVFLVKLNSEGVAQWAKKWGGNSHDTALKLLYNKQGHFVMAGAYRGTITLGGKTLPDAGKVTNTFLAKLDMDGKIQWAQSINGKQDVIPNDLKMDTQGNFYISGYYYENLETGTVKLSKTKPGQGFVAKFDTQGQVQWVQTLKGDSSLTRVKFDVMASGALAVSCQFKDSIQLGQQTYTSPDQSISGIFGVMTPNGSWEQVWQIAPSQQGDKNIAAGQSVMAWPDGSLLLGGSFWESMTYSPSSTSSPLKGLGQLDIFIARFFLPQNP